MGLTEDIQFVRSLLEAYSEGYDRMGVAAENGGSGVPPEMFDGPINDAGWVAWRMLPSTLSNADISHLEDEFTVTLPPLFRAYLLAGFQLFDQIHSSRHDQLIFNTPVPANDPLGPLRRELTGWRSLIDASLVPFAEWGDCWGPMCFDTQQRLHDGDCPIVWLDHELLIPLGEQQCRVRESVAPHINPIFDSYADFLTDTFSVA